MKKLIIAAALCSQQSSLARDMSHCLENRYVTPIEAEAMRKQYVDFHQKHRVEAEGATDQILEEEAQQIVAMVNLQKCMMQTNYKENPPYHRAFHNKTHGCVASKVHFLGTGAGVFAEKATKPGIVRFSNGAINANPDAGSDIRGFALKVQDMDFEPLIESGARELDFLLINMRNSPARNFAEFMDLSKLGGEGLLGFFEKVRVFGRLLASGMVRGLTVSMPDVTAIDYHSNAPYLYNETQAAKYRVKAVSCASGKEMAQPTMGESENFLGERLKSRLEAGPICFDFALQARDLSDPKLDLTDDRNWWEGDDFKTVARLELENLIPAEKCEALRFNPWHAPLEHKPLGSINRARASVYDLLSDHRHKKNSL